MDVSVTEKKKTIDKILKMKEQSKCKEKMNMDYKCCIFVCK